MAYIKRFNKRLVVCGEENGREVEYYSTYKLDEACELVRNLNNESDKFQFKEEQWLDEQSSCSVYGQYRNQPCPETGRKIK